MNKLWTAAGAAAWGAAPLGGLQPYMDQGAREKLAALCPGAATVLVAAFAAGHCLPIAAAGASSALCSAYLSSRFADFAQNTGRKAAGLLIAAAGAAVIAAI